MSKEKLLLVGAGGFGRVTLEYAENEYDCAFVDDGFEIGTKVDEVVVIGHITDLPNLFAEYKQLVVTIGNNVIREKIYRTASAIGYTFPNIIDPSAYISPHATIGIGCIILNNAVVENGAKVGNGTILNPGVELHCDCEVGENCLIYTNSVVRTYAHVGNRVKIGSTVTISNEAVVLDDTMIDDGRTVGK